MRAITSFDDGILVAASDAIYIVDNDGCRHFKTEVDHFILENGLFSVATCNNTIAIGTVGKGVVLIDKKGKAIDYFNESHGLQDNTVLSLFFDSDSNLWLGQDNGISFIALHYPLKNLYAHPNFYGSGYAAELFNHKLYLGTNRGLYTTDWLGRLSENAPLLLAVSYLQGQVWSLSVVDNKLFCCMDSGLFVIDEKDQIKKMDLPLGVWSFRLMLDNPSCAWISTYNGFYTTVKMDGSWGKPQPVVGSETYTIINYEEIDPGVLMLRNSHIEFIKVVLNASRTEVLDTTTLSLNNIPVGSYLYRVGKKVICYSRSGFYTVDKEGNLAPDEEMNDWTQWTNRNHYYKGLSSKYNLVCVLSDQVLGALNQKSEHSVLRHHAIPLIANFEHASILNDSMAIIPNENGFALWEIFSTVQPSRKLQIVKVESTKSNSPLYVNSGEDGVVFSVPFKDNSLRFYSHLLDYSKPSGLTYSCQLDNAPWVDQPNGLKEFENIGTGRHTFRVKMDLGEEGESKSIITSELHFIVLSPWYRTTWFYGIYIVLFILLCLVVRKWDEKRIKAKNRQLEMRQKRQIHLKEQEISQLKTERLELEVKHKNQELANTAIHLARKNEVLTEIKDDLLKVAQDMKTEEPDMSSLRRKILILNNKIIENIFQDNSLKKFEEHFDLVHNKFMEHLTQKYPDLTSNERKMCAFIKMNLSSKEIAPLLSISTRGVETLRYRLRKKLGLKQEDNLTSFLNKF